MNKEECENKMNKITKELLNEQKIDKENFTKNFLMKKTNAKDIVLSMGINPGREEKQYKANEKVNDYIYFWNTKNLTKKEKHDLKVFNDYYVFKHSYHSENYKIFSKLDAKAHWGQEDYLSEDEIKKMLKNCGKDLKENYVKRIVEIIRKMQDEEGNKKGPYVFFSDLIWYSDSNQKTIEEALKQEIPEFNEKIIELVKLNIEYYKPKLIVVTNSFASKLIEKAKFNSNDDLNEHNSMIELFDVPIILASMVSGRKSMDIFSKERLKEQIAKVYKRI